MAACGRDVRLNAIVYFVLDCSLIPIYDVPPVLSLLVTTTQVTMKLRRRCGFDDKQYFRVFCLNVLKQLECSKNIIGILISDVEC